jgi:hypothetical protein
VEGLFWKGVKAQTGPAQQPGDRAAHAATPGKRCHWDTSRCVVVEDSVMDDG